MRTIGFLLRRFAAQRLLGLALVVAFAFTIGVLVAGPIYAAASREAIASAAVRTAPATVRNLRLATFAGPTFDHAQADAEIRAGTADLPVDRIITQGRGEVRVLVPGAEPLSSGVLFRDGAEEHLRAFEGRPPTGAGEVALPIALAELLGVGIGDMVTVIGPTDEGRELLVTATFEGPRPDDPFWFGSGSPFPRLESRDLPPAIVDPAGYLELAPSLALVSEFTWDLYLDLADMPFDEVIAVPGLIRRDVARLRQDPQLAELRVTTGLDTLFVLVGQRVDDLRVPILLVVFQVGAVALAILAGVGSLVLTRQSFELAVLRSRGFSRGQLLTGQAINAVLSAAVAFPLGLLLGAGLASVAARSNAASLSPSLFPIRLNADAVALGVVGAVLGVVTLILLSLPHVRRTILEERRLVSREDRPLLARAPIEAFILPLAAFAFIQLRTTRVPPSIEQAPLEPLVLLTPTLLVFGLSFLALRLLLFVLRRFDRPIGRTKRLSVYLAARRLGRSPGASFAVALLLVLSVGLMVVATSYRAIVLQNHEDAARQQVGADWNVAVDPPEQPLAAALDLAPGATPIIRAVATFDTVGTFSSTPFAIGVDPRTYRDGGWWRDDYSATPEDEWLAALRVQDPAVPIPPGPQPGTLTVDAEAMEGADGLELVAVVERPAGQVDALVLGVLGDGYTGRAEDAQALAGASLLSISLRESGPESPDTAVLRIRSINGQAAAPLLTGWEPFRWRGSDGTIEPQEDGSVILRLEAGAGHVVSGIAPATGPLPALVSPGVATSEGDVFETTVVGQRLEFRAVAIAEHFPSVPKDFVVASAPGLLRAALRIPEPGLSLGEVWATGPDPRPALLDAGFTVGGTTSAEPIEDALAQLPQSFAVGLDSATAVGGLALVVIGVAVGLCSAQRRREFEFASLRAMGIAPSQIARVLALEQGVLVGFAMAVGAGLGFAILAWLLPYVGRSLGAPFPEPVLVVDRAALGASVMAIVAATAVGLGAALRALTRASVTTVLRGEAE